MEERARSHSLAWDREQFTCTNAFEICEANERRPDLERNGTTFDRALVKTLHKSVYKENRDADDDENDLNDDERARKNPETNDNAKEKSSFMFIESDNNADDDVAGNLGNTNTNNNTNNNNDNDNDNNDNDNNDNNNLIIMIIII